MLHISPRIPNQPFADLPTEEEVLDFMRFLGHCHDIHYLMDVNVNKHHQPWRSFASVINKCLTGKSSRVDSFRLIHWHYVRDDALFSTIKVVSRHQATQQYGAILPIELTIAKIRNNKAYQEYQACAMGEAAPKPKVSARKKKGDSASSTTPPTPTPTTTAESAPRLTASAKGKQPLRAITPVEQTDLQRTESEQLKIVLKQSRQETHISQQSGSSTGEGTEEELAKDDEEDKETGKGSDEVRESECESEEEEGSFDPDPIPRTPEDSEKES
nr:hypothetical protein [Tanacetum cinerariifolium]